MASDRSQRLASDFIGHIAGQHFAADVFQIVVNTFKRVGRIFGVGIKQFEQHFFGVFNQPRRAARAHTQQTENRYVLVVDREQDAFALEAVVDQIQDKRRTHRAWLILVSD